MCNRKRLHGRTSPPASLVSLLLFADFHAAGSAEAVAVGDRLSAVGAGAFRCSRLGRFRYRLCGCRLVCHFVTAAGTEMILLRNRIAAVGAKPSLHFCRCSFRSRSRCFRSCNHFRFCGLCRQCFCGSSCRCGRYGSRFSRNRLGNRLFCRSGSGSRSRCRRRCRSHKGISAEGAEHRTSHAGLAAVRTALCTSRSLWCLSSRLTGSCFRFPLCSFGGFSCGTFFCKLFAYRIFCPALGAVQHGFGDLCPAALTDQQVFGLTDLFPIFCDLFLTCRNGRQKFLKFRFRVCGMQFSVLPAHIEIGGVDVLFFIVNQTIQIGRASCRERV